MMRVPSRPSRSKMALCASVAMLAGFTAMSASAVPTENDAAFRNNTTKIEAVVGANSAVDTKAHRVKADPADRSSLTATPIKHVILIIGENRTFDHIYGTWLPPKGQTVRNLVSQGILNADGTPGPNVAKAQQWQATDTETYSPHPTKTAPYSVLPDVNTGGTPTTPYFSSPSAAEAIEPALPSDAYPELASGGSGLPKASIDTRFPSNLPNAPIDMHASITDNDYASSPVHRFFQMWQQIDCSPKAMSVRNPGGCQNDLFPWVETTVGAGSNGAAQPSGFNDQSTHEGSTAMQVLNMAAGDSGYFKSLAEQYALSDNMHQSIQGGTGANHIMLGYGSLVYYADASGMPAVPPAGQIENPNPQAGTDNYYTQDGYGSQTTGAGGSYVNCSDDSQPGVAPIKGLLKKLPYTAFKNGDCAPGAYYLVNNYNPGYLGDGTPAPLGATQFTIPPTTQNNIGLLLSKHNVSWKYYGEGWDGGKEDGEGGTFCNICDPFLYSTQIMTDPSLRAHNQDLSDLTADIDADTLPAVSIVKPDALLDGHPASSKQELFEAFCQKIIEQLQANPDAWKDTAVMITYDEGGGYWDSGYIQPIDFFGDGTRIPLLVVSPYSLGGRVVHDYYDHVSFDKFVEANWMLHETISERSRDNLPNPVARPIDPYVPTNQPAIGDLMAMFDFSKNGTH
ncbi:MAG: phosphoesterase [Hydrocarboniphaga sp.]|uniref:alkaline phosphatase family protein n=1 Tax=Hydrocarboniphaga sp. TaxID=2033016 RepID=UPI00263298F6|nr:alkaline phosphatase family protein [Hydrocarboniphaga sp.]MDB5971274.1 phosphoesterase [Hydrocarboniphaga sp.]